MENIDEILDVSLTIENMALVHEIALNDEFKIDERPLNILEKQVKEFLHKAFWDNFRENFMRESSDHSHELKLLRDIKKVW